MSNIRRQALVSRRLGRIAVIMLGLVFWVASASATPQPVVPWLDQRPVKASAHPPLAPPCRPSALRARLFLQGATGSLVGGVDLVNVGSVPCSLVGWPNVSLTGTAAAATHWQVKKVARSLVPRDVLADPPGSLRALRQGKSATVLLFWSNWCGPGSQPAGVSGMPPDAIKIGWATVSGVLASVARAPRCDSPQAPSTLSVGPFTPTTRRLPASSRLPLRAVIVGPRPVQVKPGLRAFHVHRGALLRYRIALTNTADRSFRFASSSCPVYIEQLEPGAPHVFVLNCRPVSSIAAHATAVFAMQIAVPTRGRAGNTGLTWELAPRTYQAPFASAAVWVVR